MHLNLRISLKQSGSEIHCQNHRTKRVKQRDFYFDTFCIFVHLHVYYVMSKIICLLFIWELIIYNMLNNLKSSYLVEQAVCKLQNPKFKSVLFFVIQFQILPYGSAQIHNTYFDRQINACLWFRLFFTCPVMSYG